jgi:hypothetical protein
MLCSYDCVLAAIVIGVLTYDNPRFVILILMLKICVAAMTVDWLQVICVLTYDNPHFVILILMLKICFAAMTVYWLHVIGVFGII